MMNQTVKTMLACISAACGAVLLSTSAHAAASLTFDANLSVGGTHPLDGSGTWDNTTANWWSPSVSSDVLWNSTSNAIFGAGADAAVDSYAINVPSSLTVSNLTFANTGYILSSGTAVNVTNLACFIPSVYVASGKTASIGTNATIYCSGGPFYFGFPAGNAVTADVAAGTLNIRNGGKVRMLSNSSFILDGSGAVYNVFTGGALSHENSSGKIQLGASVNAGITTTLSVQGGTVTSVGNPTSMYVGNSGNGTLNLESGTVTLSYALNLGNASSGMAAINLDGGMLTLGSVTKGSGAGTFNFNGGTLKANASTTTFLSGLSGAYVRNGGAVIDDGGKSITVAQPLLHTTNTLDNAIDGGLSKNGTGNLTLSGASTYTGANILSAGAIILGLAENAGIAGPLGKSAANNPGNIVFNGGTLQYSSANQFDYSGRFSTAPNQAYRVSTAGFAVTWATPLTSAGGSLFKGGSQTLTLNAAETYNGQTTVGTGTLALGAAGSLNNSTNITVSGGAVLDSTAASGLTLSASQTLVAGRTSSFTTDLNGNLVSAGNIYIAGSSYGTLTLNGNLSLTGGAVYFDLNTTTNGANDELVVSNNLSLSGSTTIQINYTALANGRYHLIAYSGSKTAGSAAANLSLTLNGPAGRFTAALDDSVAGFIDLVVTASPATMTWAGNGGNNYWDLTTTADWINGGSVSIFFNGDNVTFADPATNPVVNLQGALTPGSVTVNAANNYTFASSGGITGAVGLTKNNTGTLTVANTNSFSGATVINGGTLQLGNGSVIGTLGSGPVTDNASLVLDLPGTNTVANVISGSGSITQVMGTITLSGNNGSYTGATEVQSGATLKAGHANALSAAPGMTTVDTGAALDLNGQSLAAEPVTLSGPGISGAGAILNGSGTSASLAGAVTLAANTTLGSGSYTLSGVISGNFGLTKASSGTVALAGANSYSGGTLLSGGELDVNNGGDATHSAIGTNTLTISGGTLGTSAAADITLVPSVPEVWTGGFSFNGVHNLNTGPGPVSLMTNNGAVSCPGATLTVGGPISGPGALIKGGGGTLALAGANANTYTGTNAAFPSMPVSTLVYNGTILLSKTPGVNAVPGDVQVGITNAGGVTGILKLGASEQIPDTAVVWMSGNGNNAFFRLSGYNETIAGLADFPGAAGIEYVENDEASVGSDSVLTLNESGSYIFSGTMRDHNSGTNKLGLVKLGAGQQILAGSGITYSGSTLVSAGTLVFSNATSMNTSVTNNAMVVVTGPNGNNFNNGTLSGSGTWVLQGPGTNQFKNCTVAASGQFQVQSGILQNNNNNCVWKANLADMDVSSGATLDLYADAIYVNRLTGLGQVQNNYGNTSGYTGHAANYELLAVGTANGSSTFDGSIVDNSYNAPVGYSHLGGVDLLKVGTGTFTLTGNNSYSGNTTVSNGTLAVTGSGSIGNSPAITVVSPGVFDVSGVSGFALGSQTLGGNGTVGGALNTGSGTVQPGGAMAAGTLTFNADLTAAGGSTLSFDLANNTTVGSGSNDLIVVNGNLDLSSPGVNVAFNFLNGSPAVGTYTLIKYGTFSGAVANLNLPVNARYTYSFQNDTVAKAIKVTVTGVPAHLTWVGDGSFNGWDNAGQYQSWLNGVSPNYFYDGDFVTFDSTGYNTPSIYLASTLTPGSVTVNSVNDYDFAGPGALAGSFALVKNNSATLILENNNTYTGGTVISGGTLQVGNGGTTGSLGSGPVTNNAALVFNLNSSVSLTQPITGSGSLTLSGLGNFLVTVTDGYTGPTTINSGQLQIGNGGTNGSIAASSAITNNGTLVFDHSDSLVQGTNFAGPIVGTGSLVKSGAGTLTLTTSNLVDAGGANSLTFSGAGSGTVVLRNPAALGVAGASVNFAGGGSGVLDLQLDTPINPYVLNSGNGNGATVIIDRATPGAGFQQPLGNVTSSSVTWNFNRGTNITSGNAAVSLATVQNFAGNSGNLVIAGNADISIGDAYISLNPMSKPLVLDGTSSNNMVTDNIYDGIANATNNVIKANTSTWTLLGTNTYSGTTAVNGGSLVLAVNGQIVNSSAIAVASNATLVVNGQIPSAGLVSVSAGGTLSGGGTIAGGINIALGGNLAPGGASIGTLTVNNNLTLSGNLLVRVNKSLVQSNDFVTVTGSLSCGSGAVTVTNLNAGQPLVVGDRFQLFNAPVVNGNAMSIAGGGAGVRVTWQNNLAFDGSITVLSIAPLTSTNANLVSLKLNPNLTFSPAFNSNVLTYTATESYGSMFSVTVTNGDTTATNTLTYNGSNYGVLASGGSSTALTLNANPGYTNQLTVLVRAQDGVTTKTYTVNVVQLPSQTPPNLAGSTIGNTLTLNWPLANLGYRLLVQTNNLNKGVSANINDWMTVPNSAATNRATINLIQTNSSEFYRLVYP